MEAIDDDFFSDDGFDDLPADALQQLEHEAFRATQAEPPTQAAPQTRVNWAPRDAVDSYPQIKPVNTVNTAITTLQPPAQLHTGLTNDYGALDVGELDAEVFDNGLSSGVAFDEGAGFPELPSRNVHDTIVIDDDEPMQAEGGQSYYSALQKDHEILTTQLQQENERYARLESELANAKSMAETKTGEIAIIRSNQAKMIADYERQIAGLRKAMAEETARYKQEVETARREGKMLATENVFLKQDLAEEALRSNQVRAKTRVEEKGAPATPKKTKMLPFRDGFNDEEILAVSPSKSGRSKQTTPTVAGKKRRRASQDGPTPLQLSPQGERSGMEAAGDVVDEAMLDSMIDPPIANETTQKSDSRDMHLVKQILNHRTLPHKTDIEVMSELTFPSGPQQTLSSILLEETAKHDFGSYAVEHMQAIITLWSRALKEKYYQPIPMFLEITRYILTIDTASIMRLLNDLIPVLLTSGEVNGIPRFKNSPYARQNFGKVRLTPASQLEPLVDSTETVTVLYEIACRTLSDDELLERFWRRIDYSFVLMMLSCSQPICDIKLTLSLLMTSVRAESFASIHESSQDQNANENWVIDRVASLLWETLQPDEGQPPYTKAEVCDMRLEALSFLTIVAFNPISPASTHGSLLIASHNTTLAKLVRAMHDELDALYSFPPERDMHSSMVNGLMRVIYSVVRRHPKEAELQPKLERLSGGKQQFLVVLTRLAFSEGLVLEAGIEDETVEMAHEILDDAVNPQEAEALLEAFPHAKGDMEVKNTEKDTAMEDTVME
ncbi:putative DNA repair protein Rad26 [Aspergillus undulatus]|uniref:putative DNA repair protein Rad26 n=1 Tax=Aspergillus undulatus TaxID=1810928 RepID=UPI003CCC9994